MEFYFALLLDTILVSNVVLAQFMGICPFLGVSRKLDSAVGMGCSVTVVLVLATAATWVINTYFLLPYGLDYLRTLIFILVIAALVQLLEITMKKYLPALHRALGIYLPLITTNCAVLGVALTNVQKEYSIAQGVINGIGTSAGFALAIVILAGLREKMEYNDVTESFQGTPIVLITASLMAIAFFGFSGLI